MLTRLRDLLEKKYNYISLTVAVLSLIVTLFGALWAFRPYSDFLVKKISEDVVIYKNTDFPDVRVSYKGEDVLSLYATVYKMENRTSQSYVRNDIVDIFPFIYIENINDVMAVDIIKKHPEDMHVSYKIDYDSNRIYFDFSLMNSDDRFEFKILSKNFLKLTTVGGRVKGLNHFELDNKISKPKIPGILLTFFMGLLLYLMIRLFISSVKEFLFTLRKKEGYELFRGKLENDFFPAMWSTEDAVNYVNNNLFFMEKIDYAKILVFIQGVSAKNNSFESKIITDNILLYLYKWNFSKFFFFIEICFSIFFALMIVLILYVTYEMIFSLVIS
jgi:hypothetical protein